jgi:hypothetical protein
VLLKATKSLLTKGLTSAASLANQLLTKRAKGEVLLGSFLYLSEGVAAFWPSEERDKKKMGR